MTYGISEKVIDGIREAKRKETGKEPSDEEVEKLLLICARWRILRLKWRNMTG